jgi:hypothetical protein
VASQVVFGPVVGRCDPAPPVAAFLTVTVSFIARTLPSGFTPSETTVCSPSARLAGTVTVVVNESLSSVVTVPLPRCAARPDSGA